MKVNKKAVVTTAAVLGVAAVVAGGTIAYFTDHESVKNTFTVGNVDITVQEYALDGTPYVDGEQLLAPGSSKTTAVAKNVTVKSAENSSDAWVWVEMLIPSGLYTTTTQEQESNVALHYNQFVDYLAGYTARSTNPNAVQLANLYNSDPTTYGMFKDDHEWSIFEYVGQTEFDSDNDGVNEQYAKLRTKHTSKVVAGEETSPAVSQFYMDDDVYFDHATNKYMIPADGSLTTKPTEFTAYDGSWEVVMNAYAMQAAGFATIDDAIAAYNS